MFLVCLSIFAALGTSLAVPLASSISINEHFVYPNTRKSDGELGGRIVGGFEAKPHEFPYQVGFYVNSASGQTFCGGSLVSKDLVLTAAHCLDTALSVDLIIGAYHIDEDEPDQIKQSSDDFIIHPGWDRTLLINDIGFVKLSEPVTVNEDIQFAKIATGQNSYAGDEGIMTGWGRTENGQDSVTSVLRYTESIILTNDACKSIDPYDTIIQSRHMCLSGSSHNQNVGTCNGDSGGPLTVDGVLVGVVSFGYNDCEAGKPSVFTRLTEFTDWIRENTGLNI